MEKSLSLHLSAFGAVEVRGPKWCGKTWLSLSQSNSVVRLDNPHVRASVGLDTALALQGESPHLVDEWQEVPAVWDAVRRANPLAQNPEPAALGVLCANAPFFFKRPDGVYVIPMGCLGV